MADDNQRSSDEGFDKASKPTPMVLSINICDTVIRDEMTKKISLIGLFSAIRTHNFPCTHNQIYVYVALTEGHGKYKTEIRFLEADNETPIAGIAGELDFASPLHVAELNTCWQQLCFPRPGQYIVQVLCDNQFVGSRRFMVIDSSQDQPESTEANENYEED